MLESVKQDLNFAVRTLRRSPGYTLVALLTLLLGIGANTAVFSVVHGVLLRPLPYPEPERLVRVFEVSPAGGRMGPAWRNFTDWRERTTSFDALAAHTPGGSVAVVVDGVAERVAAAAVSRGFFEAIGRAPATGRAFLPGEHMEGAAPAAVVSHAFWQTRLGGRPVQGLRLAVDGLDVQVVGVMPADFDYPAGVELWTPFELDAPSESRTSHGLRVLGRLGEGVSATRADAELDAITATFLEDEPDAVNQDGYEDFWPAEVELVGLHEATVGMSRKPLLILLGASVLVLLVACTNLASTTLARGTARTREIALRRSLGAGRSRVVRQLFTEGLVLALAGAALGVVLAAGVVRVLPLLAPEGIPRLGEVGVDGTVLAFTLLVAVVTAVLSSLLPALRDVEGTMAATLRSGGRAGEGRGEQRLWRGLVSLEVGMALLLLVGSGLLLRSFQSVLSVDPGYATEGVLTTSLVPPSGRYPTAAERTAYFQQVQQSLENLPGVRHVGLASAAPMSSVSNGRVDVRGAEVPGVSAEYQLVSSGYFAALGIPLIRGELFTGSERPDGEHVVLVNRRFAEAVWPGEDPIGKQVTGGGMDEYWDQERWATVVGVVGDVRQSDLTAEPVETLYFPLGQRLQRTWSMTAVIRPERGDATALAPAVREALHAVSAEVPVQFSTIEERLSGGMLARRFTMTILLVFAGVALLLACVGIYGVVAYAVERRTKEIGIRIALGAEPAEVRAMVRGDFLTATAVGVVAGSILALWMSRLMGGLLYGVRPSDPLTFAAVILVLTGAAWLASYVPSLRASRISPMQTMRSE